MYVVVSLQDPNLPPAYDEAVNAPAAPGEPQSANNAPYPTQPQTTYPTQTPYPTQAPYPTQPATQPPAAYAPAQAPYPPSQPAP